MTASDIVIGIVTASDIVIGMVMASDIVIGMVMASCTSTAIVMPPVVVLVKAVTVELARFASPVTPAAVADG